MWLSKKKYQELEKRIADLEGQVQGQQVKVTLKVDEKELMKNVANGLNQGFKSACRRYTTADFSHLN